MLRNKKPAGLVHALFVKSFLEILFLITLATIFSFETLPPIRGSVEVAPYAINGWAVNTIEPWARVEVQLFIDQKLAAKVEASNSRPDVVTAGLARDEWHGFHFPITSIAKGLHQARIYGVHESRSGARLTMQAIGAPVYFELINGTLTKVETP
jgi:hypothetical protein